MKKIATLLLVAITLTASAQKKDSLTADTKFISINDLYRLAEPLKDKVTAKQFEGYTVILNEVLKEAIAEYQKKKEEPKK